MRAQCSSSSTGEMFGMVESAKKVKRLGPSHRKPESSRPCKKKETEEEYLQKGTMTARLEKRGMVARHDTRLGIVRCEEGASVTSLVGNYWTRWCIWLRGRNRTVTVST